MNKMIKATVCSTYNNTDFCTYENDFNDKNIDKSNLTEPAEGPWRQWRQVPEEEKINLSGQSTFFDGSGFIYDFPIDKTIDDARSLVTNVLKIAEPGAYFSEDARAYIFVSMYFEPNRNYILERATLFELMSSGVVEITDRKTYLKPVSSAANGGVHFQIDLALLIVTIVGYVLNMSYNVWKTRQVKELYALRNLIKYVIVALVIAYFSAYYQRPSKSLEQIVNSTTFQTFYVYGQLRQDAVTYMVIAFFLQSITIIRSFVFSRTINVFLNIFAISYKDFLSFLLLFFSTFMGFSFVWWITFGPYSQNLQNLVSTAFEIFLYFATGNTLVINELFAVSEVWATVLVIITCFIVFIQLDALMMSLVQENVRYLYMRTKPAQQKTPLREAIATIMRAGKAFIAKTKRFGKRFSKKDQTGTKKR